MRTAGVPIVLVVFLFSIHAMAQTGQHEQPSPDPDDPMGVVPLVDKSAPLVVIWFTEVTDVPLEDSSAIESQMYEDFGKRMDIRMMSREKTLKLVNETGDVELQQCLWEDACLLAIGRLLEADRIVGIKLSGSAEEYYLAFKFIDLEQDEPGRLTNVISGSLSKLLMSGASDGVAAILDKPAPAAAEPEQPARPPAPRRAELVQPKPRDEEPVVFIYEKPGFFRRHLGSTIALGVGLVAAGTGIGFGVMSRKAGQDVEFQWNEARDQDGRDNALAADVLFGLAGAAVATAVVLFLLEPGADDDPGVSVTPTGAGALVRF